MRGGPGLNKRERGGGGETQSVRGNYNKSFKGTKLTLLEGIHHVIMYIL